MTTTSTTICPQPYPIPPGGSEDFTLDFSLWLGTGASIATATATGDTGVTVTVTSTTSTTVNITIAVAPTVPLYTRPSCIVTVTSGDRTKPAPFLVVVQYE